MDLDTIKEHIREFLQASWNHCDGDCDQCGALEICEDCGLKDEREAEWKDEQDELRGADADYIRGRMIP